MKFWKLVHIMFNIIKALWDIEWSDHRSEIESDNMYEE